MLCLEPESGTPALNAGATEIALIFSEPTPQHTISSCSTFTPTISTSRFFVVVTCAVGFHHADIHLSS